MFSRPVRCLFLILSAALCAGAALSSAGCAPTEPPVSLSILTFNLRHNVDCWEERMDLIADGIAALHPDLIGLQEVERSVEQGEILADMLLERGLDYELRQASKPGVGGALTGEGIGIMSLLPLDEVEALDLVDARVAIAARVTLPDDSQIDLFNTHLSAAGDQDAVRAEQMDAVLALAEQRAGARATVLVGDLNSDPEDDAIEHALAAGLSDAWAGFGADDAAGFTSGIDLVAAKTGVAQQPNRRIDYVLLRATDLMFGATRVVLDEPAASGLYPSDHLGVIAEIHALVVD